MKMTITEALAELRTLEKRLAKKREFVLENLSLPAHLTDPLAYHGGIKEVVKREMQSIADMEERMVRIRDAITEANHSTTLTIGDVQRTIHQWLIWRREVAEGQQQLRQKIATTLAAVEKQVRDKVIRVQGGADEPVEEKPLEIIYALDRKEIVDELDDFETILGTLDGRLTLINAQATIEVE